MEQLKHECGIAIVRLRKPLEYYRQKYGSYSWGLNKLYLLMEKQHNRGQEAAGIGAVKLNAQPGHEYVFRERALGSNAIQKIFEAAAKEMGDNFNDADPVFAEEFIPFLAQIYMGHLRYSTTGKSGLSYVHPFLRRNNWRSRNLLLCGNFNMTNVDSIFQSVVNRGQHPRLYSDTIMLLEQLGDALDKENHRQYRRFRDTLVDPELSAAIENNMDLSEVLKASAPSWDGGYVICGVTGSGDSFVLRDPRGIRPAFYYVDDEVIIAASERPVIQTVINCSADDVHEIANGDALIINKNAEYRISHILAPKPKMSCSFERIYFSRGSDSSIYNERKQLGANLVKPILEAVNYDFDNTVFSFIPNTAEVAFFGLMGGLERYLDNLKIKKLKDASSTNTLTDESIRNIMNTKLRVEKVVIKDIKLRTFIAEGEQRNDLAAHVYDVTYGSIRPHTDTVVVIDDSIVRGTTLRQSILTMLNRLHPRKIVVVSSSPQVRYPDYYGIDMSRLSEFIAFKAAVELLKESGRSFILNEVYAKAIEQIKLPVEQQVCVIKDIYAPFTDKEISEKIAEMLTRDSDITPSVEIIYQSNEGLRKAIPDHTGDWYFTGNYPTPGGVYLANKAYINFFEGNPLKRS